jgi:hypothetical protein
LKMERKTRFELATSSLARRRSTAELLPLAYNSASKSSQLSYSESLSYPDHKEQAKGVLKAIIIPWITSLVIL